MLLFARTFHRSAAADPKPIDDSVDQRSGVDEENSQPVNEVNLREVSYHRNLINHARPGGCVDCYVCKLSANFAPIQFPFPFNNIKSITFNSPFPFPFNNIKSITFNSPPNPSREELEKWQSQSFNRSQF